MLCLHCGDVFGGHVNGNDKYIHKFMGVTHKMSKSTTVFSAAYTNEQKIKHLTRHGLCDGPQVESGSELSCAKNSRF